MSREKIQARIAKLPLLPYGMTSEDCPPVPKAVDNPEDVAEQEYAPHTLPEQNICARGMAPSISVAWLLHAYMLHVMQTSAEMEAYCV